jgi:hypothetical protein
MTETSVEVDDALEIADKINVLCTRADRTRSAERPHFWWVSKHLVLIVYDKDREYLGGPCLARVRADAMMVPGQFRPVLAGAVCFFRPVVDLTSDLSLDDGCEDERRLRVRMRRRVAAGPVLDQNSLDAFAGNSRQSVLVDKRYFGILRVGKPDRVANGFIGRTSVAVIRAKAANALLVIFMVFSLPQDVV